MGATGAPACSSRTAASSVRPRWRPDRRNTTPPTAGSAPGSSTSWLGGRPGRSCATAAAGEPECTSPLLASPTCTTSLGPADHRASTARPGIPAPHYETTLNLTGLLLPSPLSQGAVRPLRPRWRPQATAGSRAVRTLAMANQKSGAAKTTTAGNPGGSPKARSPLCGVTLPPPTLYRSRSGRRQRPDGAAGKSTTARVVTVRGVRPPPSPAAAWSAGSARSGRSTCAFPETPPPTLSPPAPASVHTRQLHGPTRPAPTPSPPEAATPPPTRPTPGRNRRPTASLGWGQHDPPQAARSSSLLYSSVVEPASVVARTPPSQPPLSPLIPPTIVSP